MQILNRRFSLFERSWTYTCLLLALVPFLLAACGGTTPPQPQPQPSGNTQLNQLHWCTKPTTLFQDASQSPPTTLADWTQAKTQLNFTVYLPATLPDGSCLVTAHALVHDKVLGSMFSISYLLPGGLPLAFSETALNAEAASAFQCSPDTSNQGSLLCLGSKSGTSVVIDSKKTQKDLETLFNGLQPNVDWQLKK